MIPQMVVADPPRTGLAIETLGLRLTLRPVNREVPTLREGVEALGMVSGVAHASMWAAAQPQRPHEMSLVCRVVAESFELDKDPVADSFFKATCFLRPIDGLNLLNAQDDDQCPCRSGLAVGRCHRA
jgi:hypothetical protein